MGPRAREAAAQAVRADPNLAEAQYSLGYVKWLLEWDWPAAEASLRRAVRLDPRFALAHMHLGHLLSQIGRHSEASQSMRRARELGFHTLVLSSEIEGETREIARMHAAIAREIARTGARAGVDRATWRSI